MGDPDAHSVLEVMGKDVVHAKNMATKALTGSNFLLPTVRYIPTCDIMHNHTFQPAPLTADFKIFAT